MSPYRPWPDEVSYGRAFSGCVVGLIGVLLILLATGLVFGG